MNAEETVKKQPIAGSIQQEGQIYRRERHDIVVYKKGFRVEDALVAWHRGTLIQ